MKPPRHNRNETQTSLNTDLSQRPFIIRKRNISLSNIPIDQSRSRSVGRKESNTDMTLLTVKPSSFQPPSSSSSQGPSKKRISKLSMKQRYERAQAKLETQFSRRA